MCHEEENLENIRVLYQTVQQRRTHLSGVIVNLIGFTITANALIWSVLGQAFIKSQENNVENGLRYLFAAAFISSITVILWRWYTHYLDKEVMKDVYPSIAFYEAKLIIPDDLSSWAGVVNKAIKKEKNHTIYTQAMLLSPDQRKIAVQHLIEQNCYGCRGHNAIDIIAIVYVFLIWCIPLWIFKKMHVYFVTGLVISIFFLTLTAIVLYRQRNPLVEDIKEVIRASKKSK